MSNRKEADRNLCALDGKDGFHLGLVGKGLFNPKVQVKVGQRGRYHCNAARCNVATGQRFGLVFDKFFKSF